MGLLCRFDCLLFDHITPSYLFVEIMTALMECSHTMVC